MTTVLKKEDKKIKQIEDDVVFEEFEEGGKSSYIFIYLFI